MSDDENAFEDAQSDQDAVANGDTSGDDAVAAKPMKKRKIMEPEYPMRVSDRGNKGMASSTFLADWLSTHYEPKDETEGEIATKVYDLYFNECVRRQDAALDYHEFVAASLKVFPTISKETRVPEGKKTKKSMFTGLSMRPESPLFTLTKRTKAVPEDGGKEKKAGLNLKEFETRVTDAVKELDKAGGVGVARLKRYFGEKFPEYHVEVKTYLLINALERLVAYGKIAHEKGVGLCAYYSPIKTEEEIAEEEAAKAEEEKVEGSDDSDEKDGENDDGEEKKDEDEDEGEKEKDDDEANDFEVEKILNRKKSKGQWLYLVHWAGFDESEDTWEPLENLAGSEEIMKECTADILKAEKKDKVARQKAWKQRQKASAAKAWEPSKRGITDHLKFVLTACMDQYAATVSSIKKYVATNYAAEFDLANKLGKFKQVMEKLAEAGKISYLNGKGLSGNVALTDDGLAALSKSTANTVDNMVLEAIVAMAEPKGAAISKIKKYYAQHLPSLKTAEQPKRFKKAIETAVKKEILFQVSGLGMTGSYQLMEPYMPPPVAIRRILKNEIWQDDEYSDVEAKDSEIEGGDSDVEGPVYKPRTATKSGRKVTVTARKQAPVNVPRPKTGAKRKAASKYVDESSEEEEAESESEAESEAESEVEEPPAKKGKKTPAKTGKAAAKGGKKAPAKKTPAKNTPAKKAPAKKTPTKEAPAAPSAPSRGGKAGRGGGKAGRGARGGAKATPARKRAPSPSSEDDDEPESIASDFEEHPPVQSKRGAGAGRGKASPRGKVTAKSPAKPVNKAAKKAVPVAIGRGGGRSVRERAPTYYGTPSPEYDDSDALSDEEPKKKKSPAKKTPSKRGRGAASSPAKRGRGSAKTAAALSRSDSEPEPESDTDNETPPPPPPSRGKGRGRGAAQSPAKRKPTKVQEPDSDSDSDAPPPSKGRGRGGKVGAKPGKKKR